MSLTNDLVAWYNLDETDVVIGSTWYSKAVNSGYNLAAQAAVATAAGKIETSFRSSGSGNQLLAMSDPYKLRAGSDNFSLCCWTKRTSNTNWSMPVGKWHAASGNREYCIFIEGGTPAFSFYMSDDGAAQSFITSSVSVILNTWQFVCVTKTGTTGAIWVNATETTGTGLPASLFAGDARFSIGGGWDGSTPSSVIPGQVDLVGYWDRVLTDAEIAELYNSGAGWSSPGVVQRIGAGTRMNMRTSSVDGAPSVRTINAPSPLVRRGR